ncbi:MAG: zinc ABC transporter substrate-binding protein [Ktedonobacteraceae bacterium]|nr:zinc ABC transporter substrate-binding protein [Ktedonobacteraceae bacterium]
MSSRKRLSFSLLCACMVLLLCTACGNAGSGGNAGNTTSKVISVVAAENFYGNLVQQIGGSHVDVVSILSDPDVDPHEYESNVQNATAVAKAQLVIENSGGYDDWMDKLLSGSPNSSRLVVKAFDVAKVKLEDNEHVWYSIDNAQTIAQTITERLKQLDSADAATFDSNLQKLNTALQQIQQKITAIKSKHANTPIALTETIFLYQSGPLGLHVLTPIEFQKAVAEGNDPPANTVITTDDQINQQQVKVLIYNEQTSTAVTLKLQHDAQAHHIPIVAVTETMPKGKTYQSWMLDQLTALEQALGT